MSFVAVVPEAVSAAASDLANLGSTISEAHAAAAASTTSVVAAAQDEVSTAIAALFGSHAQQFQALSAKAAAFHDQFVQALTGGAASYVEAEAANVLGLMVGSHAEASAAAALSTPAKAIPVLPGTIKVLVTIFKALPKLAKIAGNVAARTGEVANHAISIADIIGERAPETEEEVVANVEQFYRAQGAVLPRVPGDPVRVGIRNLDQQTQRIPGLAEREAIRIQEARRIFEEGNAARLANPIFLEQLAVNPVLADLELARQLDSNPLAVKELVEDIEERINVLVLRDHAVRLIRDHVAKLERYVDALVQRAQ